jgi:hypothetical protein
MNSVWCHWFRHRLYSVIYRTVHRFSAKFTGPRKKSVSLVWKWVPLMFWPLLSLNPPCGTMWCSVSTEWRTRKTCVTTSLIFYCYQLYQMLHLHSGKFYIRFHIPRCHSDTEDFIGTDSFDNKEVSCIHNIHTPWPVLHSGFEINSCP